MSACTVASWHICCTLSIRRLVKKKQVPTALDVFAAQTVYRKLQRGPSNFAEAAAGQVAPTIGPRWRLPLGRPMASSAYMMAACRHVCRDRKTLFVHPVRASVRAARKRVLPGVAAYVHTVMRA